jgi:hypothetical protein
MGILYEKSQGFQRRFKTSEAGRVQSQIEVTGIDRESTGRVWCLKEGAMSVDERRMRGKGVGIANPKEGVEKGV